MRLRKRFAAAITSAILATAALAACGDGTTSTATSSAAQTTVAATSALSAAAVLDANTEVHATADAATVTESEVVDIKLTGTSATVDGDGAKVDGGTVTITAAGTYRLSGTLSAGQIVVNAPDATVRLILNGVTITSTSSAAIAATEIGELAVILADGSTNTLTDTSTYAEDADVNAALFSAGDLTITGTGALTVHGQGNDGIASKDGLVVDSGTITVDAVDDGVRGKDYVVVNDGKLTITSGGDGVKADNDADADAGFISIAGGTVSVESGGDGVDAYTDLVMTGGTVTVASGGGHTTKPADTVSTKGLKSGITTVLEGGTAKVDSSDDAVHSDGTVHLVSTALTAASGDDAVHAEQTLQVDGGTVDVTASVEGLEAKDIVINAGSVRVVSSDDGVNASAADSADTDSADTDADGGGPGGGPGGGESVADASVTVTGGTLVINSGGDGLDSNGNAAITGGTVVVNGPEQNGNGALDVNGTFEISGGVLLAAGSSGMVVTPATDSKQGWLSATLDSALPAGTTVQIVDADGKVVASFVTSKQAQNIVYSSSAITTGAEYQIYTGGTASGDSVGGLAASGSLGSAAAVATATAGEAPAGGGFGRQGGR
ncbi:hypothetical protein DMB66_13020 [Actinoplanes sp. ATCC 53533]|uniref:carbohydrate-binding domain-containing protein n=1 Tax=Actinoplanes sp. ATCC 53533 TaxID=1288362 RepID=UPI000F7688C6|nr:carbohydrate-binding domain-containing protein [Actinoplanes sp. ATCC 53533]RSM68592.1 hypothetical protein DMB66_13020 [Actinoplanes sp. ATCC 53533]